MGNYKFAKEDTLSVKAIAVMLMLVHHLFAFPDKLTDGAMFSNLYIFESGQTLEGLMGNFGKLCVALFMMLSGYGMYCSYNNSKPENETLMSNLIIKRIKNAYIKYWQILVLFLPIGLILGVEKITGEPIDWIKNFLAIDTTFNNEAWFLTIWLMILCFFPLLIRWFERKHSGPWSDAIWLLLFNTMVYTVIPSIVEKSQYAESLRGTYYYQKLIVVLGMLPMFMAGSYLAKYDIIGLIRNKISYGYVAKFIGIIIIAVTFMLRQNWAMRTNWGWDRLDFIYASTFCIGVALIIDGLKYVKKGLAFIGGQATGIWLIHSFFCYYYCQNLIYAPKNPILIFVFLLALSTLASWGLNCMYSLVWQFVKPIFVKDDKE